MPLNANALTSESTGLRALANCGGCAAKADPNLVARRVHETAEHHSEAQLLVGLTPSDDAAVYPLDDERALITSVDFFPPLVDDANDYGAIAAANAVSDVYAMGGDVAFALIISGFPRSVPAEMIAAANAGATSVVAECSGVVAGGHSIYCAEPVFGLAVTGFVHPAGVWTKGGARPGDVLVLSKALGTGLLLNSGSVIRERAAVEHMRVTNRAARSALAKLPDGPHAVTDVTGYGLVGHAVEMALRSQHQFVIAAEQLPALDGALAASAAGAMTSGDERNRNAYAAQIDWRQRPSAPREALLFDPQTSGGLLAAVKPDHVVTIGKLGFDVIGRVEAGPPGVVIE